MLVAPGLISGLIKYVALFIMYIC